MHANLDERRLYLKRNFLSCWPHGCHRLLVIVFHFESWNKFGHFTFKQFGKLCVFSDSINVGMWIRILSEVLILVVVQDRNPLPLIRRVYLSRYQMRVQRLCVFLLHRICFIFLGCNDTRFYDAFVMDKICADALGFGQRTNFHISPELVHLVFDISIYVCTFPVLH